LSQKWQRTHKKMKNLLTCRLKEKLFFPSLSKQQINGGGFLQNLFLKKNVKKHDIRRMSKD
jgi:hypothetical protein